ncbi:MAG: CPBP family intramembrane metalloprotease [Alphaproteobacteria bacterium]|nr:CPBP family intramembrane metalloprotease [Alphaproteobacteria bacterium]
MTLPDAGHYGIWSWALLFALLVLFPLMAAQNARVRNVDQIPRISIYISSCLVLWALFVGAMLVLRVESAPLASLGLHFELDLGSSSLWVGALTIYSLAIAASAQTWRERWNVPVPPILARVLPETPRETLAFLFIVCPTAGITEEVLFRSFAITRLAAITGDAWSATAVAALGFALGHTYQGAIGMISTAMIGLGYSVSYLATGSLMPAVVAHMSHNALSAFLFKFEPASAAGRRP